MNLSTLRILLLAATAITTARAGWMEEVARNTDSTVEVGFVSQPVMRGRTPDVGTTALLVADASLSVPGGLGLNLSLHASAMQSFDASPRLDQRYVSLDIQRHSELGYVAIGFGFVQQLGINPATTAAIEREAEVTLTYVHLLESNLSLSADVRWIAVRQELQTEIGLSYTKALNADYSVSFSPVVGATHAADNLGGNLGVVDGFSYIGGTVYLMVGLGNAYTLNIQGGVQVRSEGPNRTAGQGGISVSRSF
ncbi:MAG TPA: hypothetical protein DCY41_05255 [Opitutae bacterium]|nr:hypothetical protein [Opitutae bacterium]